MVQTFARTMYMSVMMAQMYVRRELMCMLTNPVMDTTAARARKLREVVLEQK